MGSWKFLSILVVLAEPFDGFGIIEVPISVGGFRLTAMHLLGAILIYVTVIHVLMRRCAIPWRLVAIAASFLLVVTISSVNAFIQASFSLPSFLESTLHLIFWLAFFVAIAARDVSRNFMMRLLMLRTTVAMFVAAYGLYQYVGQSADWPFARLQIHGYTTIASYSRITSVFVEPIYLSSYLGETIILVLLLINSRRKRSMQVTWLAGIAIVLVLVNFLAASLAGLASLAMAIVIGGIWAFGLGRRALPVAVLVTFVGVGAWAASYLESGIGENIRAAVGDRIQGILQEREVEGESLSVRLQEIQTGWEYVTESPAIGIGFGQLKWSLRENRIARISSLYVHLMAELGVLAWLPLILFVREVRSGFGQLGDEMLERYFYIVLCYRSILYIFLGLMLSGGFWFVPGLFFALRESVRRARERRASVMSKDLKLRVNPVCVF